MAMLSRSKSHWAVLLVLLATLCCFILPAGMFSIYMAENEDNACSSGETNG